VVAGAGVGAIAPAVAAFVAASVAAVVAAGVAATVAALVAATAGAAVVETLAAATVGVGVTDVPHAVNTIAMHRKLQSANKRLEGFIVRLRGKYVSKCFNV
jgi:hypothetical protein